MPPSSALAYRTRIWIKSTLCCVLGSGRIVVRAGCSMRFLAAIGVLAICVAIAGGVYFYGGFYDVSAAAGGNPAVEWSVRNVREASVGKHCPAPAPPAWFNDAQGDPGRRARIRRGRLRRLPRRARPQARQVCPGHGPQSARSRQGRGKDDPPAKVFWTVKNGIRMTGMPAFGGHMKDDEDLARGRVRPARGKRHARCSISSKSEQGGSGETEAKPAQRKQTSSPRPPTRSPTHAFPTAMQSAGQP